MIFKRNYSPVLLNTIKLFETIIAFDLLNQYVRHFAGSQHTYIMTSLHALSASFNQKMFFCYTLNISST